MKVDLEKFSRVFKRVDEGFPDVELGFQFRDNQQVEELITSYLNMEPLSPSSVQACCGASFTDGFKMGLEYAKGEGQ